MTFREYCHVIGKVKMEYGDVDRMRTWLGLGVVIGGIIVLIGVTLHNLYHGKIGWILAASGINISFFTATYFLVPMAYHRFKQTKLMIEGIGAPIILLMWGIIILKTIFPMMISIKLVIMLLILIVGIGYVIALFIDIIRLFVSRKKKLSGVRN